MSGPEPAGDAPVRPLLARWAAVAGILGNVGLLITFFLNWTWYAQVGALLPFALVWLAGWWRWQGRLDAYEREDAEFRIRREQALEAHHERALALLDGRDAEAAFEHRYQARRARERRDEAELTRSVLRGEPSGWRRRLGGG